MTFAGEAAAGRIVAESPFAIELPMADRYSSVKAVVVEADSFRVVPPAGFHADLGKGRTAGT